MRRSSERHTGSSCATAATLLSTVTCRYTMIMDMCGRRVSCIFYSKSFVYYWCTSGDFILLKCSAATVFFFSSFYSNDFLVSVAVAISHAKKIRDQNKSEVCLAARLFFFGKLAYAGTSFIDCTSVICTRQTKHVDYLIFDWVNENICHVISANCRFLTLVTWVLCDTYKFPLKFGTGMSSYVISLHKHIS